MSQRGGKRENAGRPAAETTVMMRIPESLVDDFKIIVKEHKKGSWVDFSSCIQQSKTDSEVISEIPDLALKFFARFRHEDDIDLAVQIATYFEIFEDVILKLPREERLYIKKLSEPKRKHSKF